MNPRGCITGNTDKHHVDYALSYPRKDRWRGHLHPVGRPGRCRNFWIKVQMRGTMTSTTTAAAAAAAAVRGRGYVWALYSGGERGGSHGTPRGSHPLVLRRMILTCGDVRVECVLAECVCADLAPRATPAHAGRTTYHDNEVTMKYHHLHGSVEPYVFQSCSVDQEPWKTARSRSRCQAPFHENSSTVVD